MDREVIAAVPGAREVAEWFGEWPSFHDAEVLHLELHRDRPSRLEVQTSLFSSALGAGRPLEVVRTGIVSFELVGISDLRLEDFSHQNVLASLSVDRIGGELQVSLCPTYGIGGWIKCQRMSLRLTPG